MEADDGGLSQFFWNSSGIYRRNVIAGLKLLGADRHLAALATVLKVFPGGEPSLEQSERHEVLNRMDAPDLAEMRAAEGAAYSAGGFEQLLPPLWKRYIAEHPDEFFK